MISTRSLLPFSPLLSMTLVTYKSISLKDENHLSDIQHGRNEHGPTDSDETCLDATRAVVMQLWRRRADTCADTGTDHHLSFGLLQPGLCPGRGDLTMYGDGHGNGKL